jgi:hypothetical protein
MLIQLAFSTSNSCHVMPSRARLQTGVVPLCQCRILPGRLSHSAVRGAGKKLPTSFSAFIKRDHQLAPKYTDGVLAL